MRYKLPRYSPAVFDISRNEQSQRHMDYEGHSGLLPTFGDCFGDDDGGDGDGSGTINVNEQLQLAQLDGLGGFGADIVAKPSVGWWDEDFIPALSGLKRAYVAMGLAFWGGYFLARRLRR